MTDLPPPPPPPPGFRTPDREQTPQWIQPGADAGPRAAMALPAAPWGSRAGALLLDWFFQFLIVATIAGIVAAVTGGDSFSYETTDSDDRTVTETMPYWFAWGLGAGFLTLFTYPWVMMGLTRGRSPGRRIIGIKVVNYDGSAVGWGRAFLREAVAKGALSLFSLGILLSYLWPLWDPHQRALHDLIVSTRAVLDRPDQPADAFGGGAYQAPIAAPAQAPTRTASGSDDLAGRIGLDG
ncbi:RDD family protein [Paraconexibacter sp.]|uniref:RDD family protein n=1 Tax=Paraconexibacter sp. TaxID=2949640 RepID=UPI003567F50B